MNNNLFRMLAVIVLSTTMLAECEPPTPIPHGPVLVGLADYHTHQFGYLGFGGTVLSHGVDPATPCIPLPPVDPSTFEMEDLVRDGLFKQAWEKLRQGNCYPSLTDLASQRMATDNLYRAWQYGLRLIVVFAVNSEFLCEVADLAPGRNCPSDREAIERQIQAAKDLEAQIDAASGGPGLGWYRIVYTPQQARDVIGQGKLAVVLGVEASNAFGCRYGIRDHVSGVPDLWGQPNSEAAYELYCDVTIFGSQVPGTESYQTQKALALFEHYWRLGARHFFPIHNMDGTAGGTALSIPLLHAENNPSRLTPGTFLGTTWFDKVSDIDRTILAVRPPIQSLSCSSRFGTDSFDGGHCNAVGISETGRYLLQMMASNGALIDIDHMSWKAKRQLLANEGILGGVYPVVSSHSGMQELNHGEKNNEGQLTVEDITSIIRTGGTFAPILPPVSAIGEEDTYPHGSSTAPHECGGTSESFVQAYRYIVDKLKVGEHLSGEPAFVGVGFGTDFGAPVPVAAAPRFSLVDEGGGEVVGGTDLIAWAKEGLASWLAGSSRTGPGGRCYPASQSSIINSSVPHLNYPFESSSPLSKGIIFDRSTIAWANSPPSPEQREYDVSFSGVLHIGMIPDFVEELYALGLTPDDLEPLWHGAEAYIRAWETAIAWKGPYFAAESDYGISESCRTLRTELLTWPGSYLDGNGNNPFPRLQGILEHLKQAGCHGFPESTPSQPTPGQSYEEEIAVYGWTYPDFRARYDELWPQGWRLHILQPYVADNDQVQYTAVWHKSTEGEVQVYGWTYEDFRAKYDELWPQGWRLHILQPFVVDNQVRYTAVWRPTTEGEVQVYGWTYDDFRAKYDELWPQGWRLHILQPYVVDNQVRYTAVWRPSTEGEVQVYGWTYENFRAKYDELRPQGWRLHILQPYVIENNQVRYTAVWHPSAKGEIQEHDLTYPTFRDKYDELWPQGWRLKSLQIFVYQPDWEHLPPVRYNAVWRSDSGEPQAPSPTPTPTLSLDCTNGDETTEYCKVGRYDGEQKLVCVGGEWKKKGACVRTCEVCE